MKNGLLIGGIVNAVVAKRHDGVRAPVFKEG